MRKSVFLPVSILALAISTAVNAEVRINGFANLTAGITIDKTDLYGYTDTFDFSNGSLFALQVSGDVNDKVSATAQIVARGNEDYEASFEWAYLSYAIDENNSLSGGRFRLPLFRYSASVDVGYSYHWITAPRSVYIVPFNNLNGVRYDHNGFYGDIEYAVQVAAGGYSESVSGGNVEGDDLVTLSLEASYESFKGRVVAGRGNTNFSQATVNGAVDALRPIAPSLASDLEMKDDLGVFLGLGLEYDNFDWFVSGELTSVETEDSFSPKDIAWYITAGKRMGKWTPHITYETRDGDDEVKFIDQISAFAPQFQPTLIGAVAGLQGFFMEEFSLLTVGVRYDWDTNIALKGEVSRYDNKIDVDGDTNSAEDTTLLNVSVHYVF